MEEAETTEKMIQAMSRLFRYNLKSTASVMPFEREKKVVEDYIYLQKMRFGSRIRYTSDCSQDTMDIMIPVFALQPLVENAIVHGLAVEPEGGRLHIRRGGEPLFAWHLPLRRYSDEGIWNIQRYRPENRGESGERIMYRVLIADDEEIERLSFSRKLKKYFGESCEVFQAENGMQAILAVDKNDTPIVIMDIGMPGMNGVEAAEWIRKSHPDCVIIFLTAYDDFSYAKRAVSLHALEYLLKPCDDEELIPVMEEAMRQLDLCRGRKASQTTGRSGGRSEDGGRNEKGIEGAHGQAGERDTGTGWGTETDPEEGTENGYSRVAAAIRAYVRENYSRDISMQDAARAMNYSEVYFLPSF